MSRIVEHQRPVHHYTTTLSIGSCGSCGYRSHMGASTKTHQRQIRYIVRRELLLYLDKRSDFRAVVTLEALDAKHTVLPPTKHVAK